MRAAHVGSNDHTSWLAAAHISLFISIVGNVLCATVWRAWRCCNDEKTFAFIFFRCSAGVNYAHSYVCTWNFRRNKICAHPRQAFLFSISLAHEMQSENLECLVGWGVRGTWAKNFNRISWARIVDVRILRCRSIPTDRPIRFEVEINAQFDVKREVTKLCATKCWKIVQLVQNRRDYKTKATTPQYT